MIYFNFLYSSLFWECRVCRVCRVCPRFFRISAPFFCMCPFHFFLEKTGYNPTYPTYTITLTIKNKRMEGNETVNGVPVGYVGYVFPYPTYPTFLRNLMT